MLTFMTASNVAGLRAKTHKKYFMYQRKLLILVHNLPLPLIPFSLLLSISSLFYLPFIREMALSKQRQFITYSYVLITISQCSKSCEWESQSRSCLPLYHVISVIKGALWSRTHRLLLAICNTDSISHIFHLRRWSRYPSSYTAKDSFKLHVFSVSFFECKRGIWNLQFLL